MAKTKQTFENSEVQENEKITEGLQTDNGNEKGGDEGLPNQSALRVKSRKRKTEATKLARLRNAKRLKGGKLGRIRGEIRTLRTFIKNGNVIKSVGERKESLRLDPAEKEFLRSKIEKLKGEEYCLKVELLDLRQEIKRRAGENKVILRNTLKNKRLKDQEKRKERRLTEVSRTSLIKASQNGSAEVISQLKRRYVDGEKDKVESELLNIFSQKIMPGIQNEAPEMRKRVFRKVAGQVLGQ